MSVIKLTWAAGRVVLGGGSVGLTVPTLLGTPPSHTRVPECKASLASPTLLQFSAKENSVKSVEFLAPDFPLT